VTEGYLFRAIGANKYFEMCICLSASLRYHGDDRPISIFTDDPENIYLKRYSFLFDKIIDIRPLVKGLEVKFNRTFKEGFELGGLAPRLLCRESPYDRTISIDGDMMALSNTARLWDVFNREGHNVTFLGCRRMYPGWGTMTAEELTAAEIQIEDDISRPFCLPHVSFREVHGGIMWWDNSMVSSMIFDEFDKAILSGKLYEYFPKVVDLWWGHLSDEVVYAYVMSILNLPVVPYNSNLMGSNPEFFSVEKGIGDMGHFLTNPRLKGHMEFSDTCPILVHYFAKDKDSNYAPNRDFLISWLEEDVK